MNPPVHDSLSLRDLVRINILVVLGACGFALYFLWPTFTNPYVLNDDVRVFLFWVHKFQEPELFRNDPLTLFSQTYTSLGVQAVYAFLSHFGDPLAPARWLPVVLFMTAAHFVFRLGLFFGGVFTGVLASAAFMSSQFFLFTMSGGLPRSFAYPFVLAFLYCLVRKQPRAAAGLLVLQPLFYAPVFLISAVTSLFCVLRVQRFRIRFAFPGARLVLGAAVLGCLIVLIQAFASRHPSIGPLMNREELLENKAAFTYPGGRNIIFPFRSLSQMTAEEGRKVAAHLLPVHSVIRGFRGIENDMPRKALNLTLIFLLAALAARVLRQKKLPMPEVFAFVGSGLVLFEAAKVFAFQLYFPNRFWLFSYPAGLLLVLAGTLAWVLQAVRPLFLQRLLQAALVLAVVSHNVNAFPMPLFVNVSAQRSLFEYLRTLPKNALIAAHPYVADDIPVFAARKTFIMYEVSNVFFTTHWEFVKKRTYELFDAYFAEDGRTILEFMERNRIDYLVVDSWHFTAGHWERDRLYFEPFESYLRETIAKRERFFLADFPEDKMLFTNGRHFVIDRRKSWAKGALTKNQAAAGVIR